MRKILIVEDDDFVLEYIRSELIKLYQVECARNGNEALVAVDEFQPDLIVMDIQMPELNGYEAAKKIREQGKGMPILFLSKLNSLEERLKAYDSGGNDFISKPAFGTELIRKIDVLLAFHKEKGSHEANQIATKALSDIACLGRVIAFYKKSYECKDFESLSQEVFSVTRHLGLKCSIVFRKEAAQHCFFNDETNKNIESAVLESLSGAARIMEFGLNRAAFNWALASLLVKNMPVDEEACGSMKDYIAYLMEGIEQCVSRIILEDDLKDTIHEFKAKNEDIKQDIVNLIDDLEGNLEDLFSSLAVNNELSGEAESALLNMIDVVRKEAEAKVMSGCVIEQRLDRMLQVNSDNDAEPDDDIELF